LDIKNEENEQTKLELVGMTSKIEELERHNKKLKNREKEHKENKNQ